MHPTELQELLQRWRLNEDSAADRAELARLLANDANLMLIENAIDAADDEQVPEGDFSATHDRILAYVRTHKNETRSAVIPLRKKSNRWTWYAAASVLALSLVGWWLMERPRPVQTSETIVAAKDIAPGKVGAILTLGDGQQIVLDTAKIGEIVAGIQKDQEGIHYEKVSEVVSYNTLSTPKGRTIQVQLEDGSKVWLNAGSSIRYPTKFMETTRRVEVTGEVYVEVSPNAKEPFVVAVNGEEVKVLGTAFNVNAYANEGSLKTTLINGAVKIRDVVLQPNEQGQITPDAVKVVKVEVEDVIAWKEGYFRFNQADIPTVMRQLERWYDIEVRYEDNIPQRQFGGELKRDLPLSSVLRFLQKAKVHFKQEGNIITIIP